MANQVFEYHLIKNRAIFRTSPKLEEIREISLIVTYGGRGDIAVYNYPCRNKKQIYLR